MSKAGSQVRAVYDFAGEPGTAELSIVTGEVLTLTRHDVGEGWWEGMNEAGETGLFPAAYVEEVGGWGPPSMPPPPLPSAHSAEAEGEGGDAEGDYWDDDDWDDEPGRAPPNAAPNAALPEFAPTGPGTAGDRKLSAGSGTAASKKNFNRFSGFGRAGVEAFLVSPARLEVSDADRVSIITAEGVDGGVRWNPPPEHELYACIVASPKKESKLKGLKSFIAYQITPTFNNIQVSRRYKHFDWLHERLEEKFTLIPIPPLPDKQISGRYEGQFIEHRRVQLQAFVRAVCRHPVLSRSSVWMHFMTCTDDKRWKVGKRREEKDKLLGANYFYALEAPPGRLDLATMESESDTNSMWMHRMDTAVKLMMATAADQAKKHQGPYKREYQKIGQSFLQLSSVLADGRSDERLCSAIKNTGDAYNEVGLLFEEQPKADWEPLGDVLHIYKGLIASFPDILAVHRGALHKRKECEKLAIENKMDDRQVEEVKRRSDVVSYALLAELNHFRSEQNMDLNEAMKSYLTEQISFYQKVVRTLQNALDTYA